MKSIRCPSCHKVGSQVTNSRTRKDGYHTRRHACQHCEHRWTTIEVPLHDVPGRYADGFYAGYQSAIRLLTSHTPTDDEIMEGFSTDPYYQFGREM